MMQVKQFPPYQSWDYVVAIQFIELSSPLVSSVAYMIPATCLRVIINATLTVAANCTDC